MAQCTFELLHNGLFETSIVKMLMACGQNHGFNWPQEFTASGHQFNREVANGGH